MPPLSNLAVRDIETLVHPYTNLATLRETARGHSWPAGAATADDRLAFAR